jgi:hypothetical protein
MKYPIKTIIKIRDGIDRIKPEGEYTAIEINGITGIGVGTIFRILDDETFERYERRVFGGRHVIKTFRGLIKEYKDALEKYGQNWSQY